MAENKGAGPEIVKASKSFLKGLFITLGLLAGGFGIAHFLLGGGMIAVSHLIAGMKLGGVAKAVVTEVPHIVTNLAKDAAAIPAALTQGA